MYITSVATGCGACVDIVYKHRALSVTGRGKAVHRRRGDLTEIAQSSCSLRMEIVHVA